MKKVVVIGCGFAGLSAASFMARAGWKVIVVDKLEGPGGRASQLKVAGFSFDMGPSWYWMPDIFERYFSSFGKRVKDYYSLTRLDPSYRIYWKNGTTDLPADLDEFRKLLESWEPGASIKLDKFLKEAEYKYNTGMKNLVFKPGLSFSEFIDWDVMRGVFRLDVFNSIQTHIRKFFRHPRIRQMLEFPVLFLGALPENTPALYSLMNYADIVKGTWYPQGGMYAVVEGMYKLAIELGVEFRFSEIVTEISIEGHTARNVITNKNSYSADVVIGGADYHFIEKNLLPPDKRTYTDKYWDERMMAPSCLLYFVGLNKKLKNVLHHSLFFDSDFKQHAKEIYVSRKWPVDPLFYVSASSVTDNEAAPAGHENLVFLIPVASGLENDDEELREEYFSKIMHRFEDLTGEQIESSIVYKKCFGVKEFTTEYNSFKGNAYGLANTLKQTAVFRPECRSRKVKNLFYTGQLTVPGPGVPPSLISGEVVAGQVLKYFGKSNIGMPQELIKYIHI